MQLLLVCLVNRRYPQQDVNTNINAQLYSNVFTCFSPYYHTYKLCYDWPQGSRSYDSCKSCRHVCPHRVLSARLEVDAANVNTPLTESLPIMFRAITQVQYVNRRVVGSVLSCIRHVQDNAGIYYSRGPSGTSVAWVRGEKGGGDYGGFGFPYRFEKLYLTRFDLRVDLKSYFL